jgi:hypothetical protein
MSQPLNVSTSYWSSQNCNLRTMRNEYCIHRLSCNGLYLFRYRYIIIYPFPGSALPALVHSSTLERPCYLCVIPKEPSFAEDQFFLLKKMLQPAVD